MKEERNDRKIDSFLKRATANGYYAFMKNAGVEMISNAADFRLIGSKALAALLSYNEANLFLRASRGRAVACWAMRKGTDHRAPGALSHSSYRQVRDHAKPCPFTGFVSCGFGRGKPLPYGDP